MLDEAEKYAENDRLVRERIEAKNSFEGYLHNVKSSCSTDEFKQNLGEESHKKLIETVTEYLQWLDDNGEASTEQYKEKQPEAENKILPLIKGAYEKQSPEYYDKLIKFKKSPSSLKQLFNYFKTKDLSNFSKDIVPLTDYKKRLIMSNLEAYHRFVLDKFDMLLGVRYCPDELYEMSINYAKANKMKSKYTEQLFFKQFKKLFGEFNKIDSKTKTSYYIFENITKDELKEQMIKKLFENK
jgi:hypothetical protein